jgi:hypothetical protein
MPTNDSRPGIKNGGLVAAAAAVPLLLTVASTSARVGLTPTTPSEVTVATCPADLKTIQNCHDKFPAGCSASDKPNYDAYLNFLKDQVPSPELLKQPVNLDDTDFNDLDAKTPAKLSTHNHADFAADLKELGEGGIRSVVAFLYFSKANPGESSNCQLPNVSDGDFHVLIGFDDKLAEEVKAARGKSSLPKDLKTRVDHNAIIVEMTPYVRQSLKHTGWDLPVLQSHWGEQVKVVGQLMIDNEHNVQSANCALADKPDQSKCWRRTVWELHPVMDFFVCKSGATCSPDSDQGWLALDNLR